MSRPRKKVTAKSFQRQVIVFVSITIVMLAAVVYFAFSKTTVVITPRTLTSDAVVELTIKTDLEAQKTPSGENGTVLLPGTVMTLPVETAKSFTGASEKQTEPARAGGDITLVNNSPKAQPLQAGTRILSESGVLFRTTERVDVPSGGRVTTAVLADEPGAAGEVAAGRFEIVALWPGLKSSIYALSEKAFTGGTISISRLTQTDLNTARTTLVDQFTADAKAAMEKELAKNPATSMQQVITLVPTITTENPGANPGDTVSAYTYTIKGSALGVAADPTVMKNALIAEVGKHVAKDRRLLSADIQKAVFTITRSDTDVRVATIKVTTPAKTVVRLSSDIFSRTPLVGLDRQDIISHFAQFDEVAHVDVHFSPFWVFRAPKLPDHIEIQLKDPVTNN